MENLIFKSLDYGFYYDDLKLLIVVVFIWIVGCEWCFVIVNGVVIVGFGYDLLMCIVVLIEFDDFVIKFVVLIVVEVFVLCSVYIMDVCECDGEFRFVEYNLFGGVDFYVCKLDVIIDVVLDWVMKLYSVG